MTEPLYLASQSPRRSQLLAQLGVRHALLLPDADEDAEQLEAHVPGETPAQYVVRVTGLKLDAALARRRRRGLPAAPVLCADTTVALGRRILGKPADAGEAADMLHHLSGRSHRVLTAVALAQGRRRQAALSVSRVEFAPLSRGTGPRLCRFGRTDGQGGRLRGAGPGSGFHQRMIHGSYSGIMGLPLFETAQLLHALGHRFENPIQVR
jgi:septum formation protein